MKTSQRGLDIIKKWEGLRTKAYQCVASVWTIGYGHTRTAKPDMIITAQKAEELLKQDVIECELAVKTYVKVPLMQNQFDALVSLIFNIGSGRFTSSSVLSKLNEGNYKGSAEAFLNHVKARVGGELTVLKPLIKRREEEMRLFLENVN